MSAVVLKFHRYFLGEQFFPAKPERGRAFEMYLLDLEVFQVVHLRLGYGLACWCFSKETMMLQSLTEMIVGNDCVFTNMLMQSISCVQVCWGLSNSLEFECK